MDERRQGIGILLLLFLSMILIESCASPRPSPRASADHDKRRFLSVMSLSDGTNEKFERGVLRDFLSRQGFDLQYIPAFESTQNRLSLYRKLLASHVAQPDIFELDVVWPPTLADGLLDLKPYLGNEVEAFFPEVMKTYTIQGRLVALPLHVDTSFLYYRADLLKEYGYERPPRTWAELENMARLIQTGERRRGNKNFWGYVWQGRKYEGLTCNALEWQASEGGGEILEDHTVRVYGSNAIRALQRAVGWVGSISPPEVLSYDEGDSMKVWRTGNAMFMRNWIYPYSFMLGLPPELRARFGVALLPGGAAGPRRVLGGIAISVSQYSGHKQEALDAIRQLASIETQRVRTLQLGSLPIRSSLQLEPEIMKHTPFQGALTGQFMTGVIQRPTVAAGGSYGSVTKVYFTAVHSALKREISADEALRRLERRLVKLTGFQPVRQ